MIMSWIKTWSVKRNNNEKNDHSTVLTAEKNTPKNADFYKNYYSLLANGARLKLIEAMFNLNLFALFEEKSCVLEHEIIKKLGLKPIRTKKWLHLLACEHFLIKTTSNNQPAYQLPDEFIQLMNNGDGWINMQYAFSVWETAANENLPAVLRFGEVNDRYKAWLWPPKTDAQAGLLEEWMTKTASWTILCILDQVNFNSIHRMLDVGGGDGTMACAIAGAHPHLNMTVYNLPEPAKLARKKIKAEQLSERVQVLEGNFIEECAFPQGFDLILFARVLYDWDTTTNKKLLQMAYQALPKNGLLAICETFKEDNHDLCLTCEYRYIFLDDFGVHVMKTSREYRNMLEEIGFSILSHDPEKLHYCSFLLAQK